MKIFNSFDEYHPEMFDQVLYKLDTNSSLFDFGEWEPGPDSDTDRQSSPDCPPGKRSENSVREPLREMLNLSN